MAGKVHYGGDEALEARVDSLESGDAWTGKTTGYVPVVQADDSIMWAPGGGGGGSDLSAVDQDITVLNNHVIDLQSPTIGSDPEAHGTISWSDDSYGVTVTGSPDGDTTDLYIVGPTSFSDRINLDVQPGFAGIALKTAGGGDGYIQQGGANLSLGVAAGEVRIDSAMHLTVPGSGIVFTSPDGLTTKTLSIDNAGDPVWT